MDDGCYACGDDNPVGLGLDITATERRVIATFLPRAEHRGAPGFLHGGIAATVLDETMASVGRLLDGRHFVTATLELRYRRPVPLDGRALRVEAWRDHEPVAPRRHHRIHGRLSLPDGTPAVEAVGIFVIAPDAMLTGGVDA